MPDGLASVKKLFSDTIYAIQKDVAKVAILALASVLYRALRDSVHSDVRSLVLRGGPAGLVLAGIFVYMLVIFSADQGGTSPTPTQPPDSSPSPFQYLRSHPLAISVTLLTVFAIDRYNLLVGLERLAIREARHFVEIAGPAVHRVLTLARPKPGAEPRTHALRRVIRWLLPPAATAQMVHIFSQARTARLAAALLEAQQRDLDSKPLVRLRRATLAAWTRWKSVFEFFSALIGLGSALKYLLR